MRLCTPATVGGPVAEAQADGPACPFVTTGAEIYWLDAASGVLRRCIDVLDVRLVSTSESAAA